MNNTIFKRNDISARAKGIYAFLLTHKSPLSKNDLYLYFKEGRDSLNTAFRELVNNKYVVIENQRDKAGKFIGSEIKLTQEGRQI